MSVVMKYCRFDGWLIIEDTSINSKFIKATKNQIDNFFNGKDKCRVLNNGCICKEINS